MKKKHIYILFWAAIGVAGCSKSQHLSPAEALLCSGPWKLQSSDTTYYDSAYHITGMHTAIVNCGNRQNCIFYANGTIQFYRGCGDRPFPQPSRYWTWSLGGKNENMLYQTLADNSPRSGVLTYMIHDSVVTLTKDSLVLYNSIRPHEYYSVAPTDYPLLIRSWFTH